MGQDYYWINDKHKVYCWLGRGINPEDYDEDEITEIVNKTQLFENEFGEELFEAVRDLKDIS